MGKYNRGNVFGLQKHNQRENKNYSNENINLLQSELNYDLANQNNINYLKKVDEVINKNRTNSDRAVRKDAIVYVETVVGSDKKFFESLSCQENKRFFQESYNYLAEKIGKENIVSAVVHHDEGNPHMHFNFVPITDGALSAKKLINRNFLRKIQEEFPKYLKDKGFDIERGMENSTKKHLEPLEFKKEQIKNDMENVKKQHKRIQNTSKALSKIEEHIKGVIHKLDKIEAKKGLFSDKLTISEQDYSSLVSLAKTGESKTLENLKLKAKVGDLENRLDAALHKKSLDDEIKDIKLKEYDKVMSDNKKLKKNFKTLEKAVNNLGDDMLDKVNAEIKNVLSAEKNIKRSRNRSFDMER